MVYQILTDLYSYIVHKSSSQTVQTQQWNYYILETVTATVTIGRGNSKM